MNESHDNPTATRADTCELCKLAQGIVRSQFSDTKLCDDCVESTYGTINDLSSYLDKFERGAR